MFNFPWAFDSREERCDGGIRTREKAMRSIVCPCRLFSSPTKTETMAETSPKGGDLQVQQ